MDAPIVTVDHIKQMARNAFARGTPRDGHNMNWHAPALPTWQAEWDRCKAEAASVQP